MACPQIAFWHSLDTPFFARLYLLFHYLILFQNLHKTPAKVFTPPDFSDNSFLSGFPVQIPFLPWLLRFCFSALHSDSPPD